MDHQLFDLVIKQFGDRYRLLYWDVRGHGRSRPMGDDFSIRTATEDLLAILETEVIDEVILVGISMGGFISQELYFLRPNLVKAMVLIDTLCITWKQPPGIKCMRPFSRLGFWLMPQRLLRWFGGSCAGTKKNTRRQARKLCKQVPKKDFLKIWRGIITCDHYEPGHIINVPLLMILGQYDYLVGLGLIKWLTPKWADCQPDCRLVTVPGAGHNSIQDNPEFFRQTLQEFLDIILIK